MGKIVDYYLSASSPYAYLGHARFAEIARRCGATVRVRPIDLARIFPTSGGLPLAKRAPQRLAYRLVELARWSRFLGLPMHLQPAYFPVASDDACRLIIAADQVAGADAAMRLAGALLSAVWAQQRDIADAATLAAIAGENGLAPETLATRASAAADAYQQYTDEAAAAQVFGVPWFVVDGESFWGQDRLDFVERALAAA